MGRSLYTRWLTAVFAWVLLLTPAAWSIVDPAHLVAHRADHSHEPGSDHDHRDHRHPAEPPDDIASRDGARPALQLPEAAPAGVVALPDPPAPSNALAHRPRSKVPPDTPVSLAVRLTL